MFAALLLLAAQDVPAPDPDAVEGEEIVVQAKLGHTTMLFDKGADGRLRNCRVMVSSGSQRRDADACRATPICYARTADIVTECRELGVLEMAAVAGAADIRPTAPAATAEKADPFALPRLVAPPRPALDAGQAGPVGALVPSRDTERQRIDLPPLPKPPSDGPVIRLGPPQERAE